MAKKQKPTRKYTLLEIYNSYHWLITHVEPFKEILPFHDIPHRVPRCFDEPLKEIGISMIDLSIEDKEVAVIPGKTPGEFFYNLPYVNVLFKWCLRYEVNGKKIPFLYPKGDTKDDNVITSTSNVRKIWIEKGIEKKDKYLFNELRKIAMIVEDYLFLQHERNQKELRQPVAAAGEGEGGKKTLSVADIISDQRVNISKSWFSKLKKRIPNFPESDTMKDHGEAWTDGGKIVEMIVGHRKAHPRTPPQKTATTSQKKHKPKRKK